MLPKSSHSDQGASFTSCLVAVVLFFGGIGFYYFTYAQYTDLEYPRKNLVYTQNGSQVQMNSFRKMAVARVCDTTGQQLDKIKKVRKTTQKGVRRDSDFDQDCAEVKNRLKEIVSDARLRRIPRKFKSRYNDGLMGIHYTYRSLVSLESSMEAKTKAQRDKHYKESVRLSGEAKKSIARSRDYFAGKDWAK